MPSMDVVSEVDKHELANAVDQANREISTRFDFKGSDSKATLKGTNIAIEAGGTFQLKQIWDVMYNKMAKRGVDLRCLDLGPAEERGMRAYQSANVRDGLESDDAKKVVKLIKNSKLKVQAQIQGEQVRVTGKKRDDLQSVIAMLRGEELDIPLQFNNFRD